MIESYIKYFFMIMCAFYYFSRLLNLKILKKAYIINFACFFLSTILVYFIRINFSYITTVMLLTVVYIHTAVTYKTSLKITLITSLLSVGLSYFTFFISTLLLSPIIVPIRYKHPNLNSIDPLIMLLTGILEIFLCFCLFRVKRLKKGMPFLLEKLPITIGIFISCFIIFLTSLFTVLNNKNYFYTLLILISIVLGFILFVWWRKQLTISYINRAHQNEISRLEEELEKVKKDNDHLARLIHKDNKLIPAMEMAVKNLLSEQSITDNTELHNKATTLLADLNKLSEERTGILNTSRSRNSLPVTGLVRLDSVISYMYEKAVSKNIKLEVTIDTDVKEMIRTTISEDILVTMIADLTENAIIATRDTATKNILLTLGMEKNNYYINIFDSGIPFEPYTIKNAGKKKASTHLDDGGSGIGLMTTFALLRECRASFIIDEAVDKSQYTKNVCILFDYLGEFRINSQREEILAIKGARPDIVFNYSTIHCPSTII